MKILFIILIPFISFSQEDTTIYNFPDVEAQFPGGHAKLVHFIITNIEYPDTVDYDVDSRIYLTFIIEKDGTLSNIVMTNALGTAIEKAYIDLFGKMPNWIPAKLNGKVVRYRCRLPIIIELR